MSEPSPDLSDFLSFGSDEEDLGEEGETPRSSWAVAPGGGRGEGNGPRVRNAGSRTEGSDLDADVEDLGDDIPRRDSDEISPDDFPTAFAPHARQEGYNRAPAYHHSLHPARGKGVRLSAVGSSMGDESDEDGEGIEARLLRSLGTGDAMNGGEVSPGLKMDGGWPIPVGMVSWVPVEGEGGRR
jgi:hypothetical protein